MCPVRRTVAGDALASRRHCQIYPPRGYRRAFGTSPGGVRRRNQPVECSTDNSAFRIVRSSVGKKTSPLSYVPREQREHRLHAARSRYPPACSATDQHAVSDRVAHPLDSACTPRTALRQDVEHPRAGFSCGNALARADAYPTPLHRLDLMRAGSCDTSPCTCTGCDVSALDHASFFQGSPAGSTLTAYGPDLNGCVGTSCANCCGEYLETPDVDGARITSTSTRAARSAT